jgi:hypothetical protein
MKPLTRQQRADLIAEHGLDPRSAWSDEQLVAIANRRRDAQVAQLGLDPNRDWTGWTREGLQAQADRLERNQKRRQRRRKTKAKTKASRSTSLGVSTDDGAVFVGVLSTEVDAQGGDVAEFDAYNDQAS